MTVTDEIKNICNDLAVQIPKLYPKGKKDEKKAFWDEALSGSNGIGRFAGRSWTQNNFKPTGDIIINNSCNFCFYNSGIGVDLIALAENLGITIDIKPISSALNMFQYSNIKGARVDFTELVAISNAFADASHMERIVLKLKEDGTNTFSGTFTGCSKLKYLTIESGYIGRSIDLSQSPLLDPDCLAEIIEQKLFDVNASGESYKYTFKLSSTSWNALNDKYPNPNMMGDWQTIMGAKGWNI